MPRQAWLLWGSLVQMDRATLGQGPLKSPLLLVSHTWASVLDLRPKVKVRKCGGELLGRAHLLRTGSIRNEEEDKPDPKHDPSEAPACGSPDTPGRHSCPAFPAQGRGRVACHAMLTAEGGPACYST